MVKKQNTNLTLLGSTLGNVLEWYDYLIYVYLAPILSNVMFPNSSKEQSLSYIMEIFALTYFSRPIGSLIFGPIADRAGRKKALIISTLLIGFATVFIGLTPTGNIVNAATTAIIIIFLRILQGISVGGEYITTAIYITEFAPLKKRGLYGSFINFSGSFGVILASFVLLSLSVLFDDTAINSYAWRFPFLLGFFSMLIALFIRTKLKESPVFEHLQEIKQVVKRPLYDSFKTHKKKMLILMVLVAFQVVGFYATSVFLNLWATTYQGITLATTSVATMIGATINILAGFLGGYLSDKIGRKPVLIAGALGTVLLSWPTMVFMTYAGGQDTADLRYMAGQAIFQILLGLYSGALPALLTELFPSRVRCTTVLLSYNLSTAIFGGTTPIIGLWLANATGIGAAPALYLTFFGVIALFCISLGFKETYEKPLEH